MKNASFMKFYILMCDLRLHDQIRICFVILKQGDRQREM